MPDNDAKPTLNPAALTLTEAAALLTRAAARSVTVAMLEADRAVGAPVNADGTLNLVHYAAWLLKEMGRGD